jgi:hypothetical protein
MMNKDISVKKFLLGKFQTSNKIISFFIFQQVDYDMLFINMQFIPMLIKEEMNIRWHSEHGLADNVYKIVDEYRIQRNLTVKFGDKNC